MASAEDLRAYFEQMKAVPDDEDTPFVLDYDMKLTRGKPNPHKLIPDKVVFTAVFSTKRLLKNAGNILHADGTYKLMSNNFPLLVFGSSDMARAFHTLAVAMTSNENTHAYEFSMRAIKQAVEKFHNHQLKIDFLVADAFEAIANAYYEIWPDGKNVICWFHVHKNVQERTRSSPHNDQILSDLGMLQRCPNEQSFNKLSSLFLSKWAPIEANFTEYFRNQWLQASHKKWYEGIAFFVPSTNNCLESTNNRIKDDFGLRHRCSLGAFKGKLASMLNHLSCEYRDKVKNVQTKVPLKKELWKSAYEWALVTKNATVVKDKKNGMTHYYFHCGEIDTIPAADFKAYNKMAYDTFDEFAAKYFLIRKVSVPLDPEKFQQATCTCINFMKEYTCRHVVGIGLRMKIINMPAEHMPITPAGKRGRPKKAAPALVRQ